MYKNTYALFILLKLTVTHNMIVLNTTVVIQHWISLIGEKTKEGKKVGF